MKLMFSGCGGAFALSDQFQTNAVVMADDGSRMLLDCGSYAPLALHEQGVMVEHIKALYISHLHADHVGGVEWLALKTYFNPKIERPKLFCDYQLMQDMWDKTLRGGLETLEGKVATLESYFDCHPVHQNKSFMWKDVKFTPVQTIHVLSGYRIMHSFGLIIDAFPDATDDERRELWSWGT
ncbi:MAG: MBL fold metallo-hydrolase [Acidobacteria bacterium]|nr:MBL fold metallo-hydrolase [Candidatus Sulfomarinibacter kjeldsenii]